MLSLSRFFMLMIIHQQMPPFPPPTLRLISHWNQTLVSGSSPIGITQSVQAHHALEDSGNRRASFSCDKIFDIRIREKGVSMSKLLLLMTFASLSLYAQLNRGSI